MMNVSSSMRHLISPMFIFWTMKLFYSRYVDLMIRGKERTCDRAWIDDPEQRTKEIYPRFAETYNEINLLICQPEHAIYIAGYDNMDPNDGDRIYIEGYGDWIKKLIEKKWNSIRWL